MSDIALLQEVGETVLQAKREGQPTRTAARLAKINRNTLYTWLRSADACRTLAGLHIEGLAGLTDAQRAFVAFGDAFAAATLEGRKARLAEKAAARAAAAAPPVNWYTGQPLSESPGYGGDAPQPEGQPGEEVSSPWRDVPNPSQ